MKKLQPLVIVLVICAFFASAFADVPPDPGYNRVSLSIIVEPAEDLADYRFFLKNGFDLKEYTLKKGEKVTISLMGGGALYRNGTFLAVPKKALAGMNEEPSGDRLNPMQKAIADGTVPGTIKLIDHSFVRDVPTAEASKWKDPFYRIEKDGDSGIKAVLVSGGQAESKTAGTTDPYYSNEPKTPAFWATVVGGSLLTLALIFFGVFVLRRSKAGAGSAGSLAK
ncbi:MAG: hypothetical protein KA956_11090 [Pyrinomonadaceae bacterium]|nr:hypothetical protein [Acidobacteriota bacterium]MBP7377010.1 hypothetical protein [Pyrinomonadaceae bacterium]